MSHFAEIDNNNTVIRVIVAEQDFINSGAVGDSFSWVQYSYNGNFRGRAAGVGGIYNRAEDRFEGPQPYPSWVLNTSTLDYDPPVVRPEDDQAYDWDETTTSWKLQVAGDP